MCGEGEGKMRRLLKFKEENLKGLHFFTENLEFPVVAASYNECDKQRLYCLERNFRSVDWIILQKISASGASVIMLSFR